jgi:hypothetical protein
MKRALPTSLDHVAGLRGARWFRESTSGQWDNFGPDAQREQQDRAIPRYGLVDTGLSWSVAASGWTTAWLTSAWQAMLAAAREGAFDILVVGYVSRFLRNLKQTLIAVEDHLHQAGVAVLFVDERLLSSDPNDWDQFVREAHEAEAHSRKLSKRVGEGYAAKRRRLGVPGGNRAPYGIVREGKPSTLRIDEETATTVRQAYQLAATGLTDWEVAAQVNLAETHVGEILTNPIYAGRLRTGEPAGVPPLIEPALWSRVQVVRAMRRTRTPGRTVKRNYPLRLRCSGCGRYLYGDTGRYRHPAPTCEAFIAATPTMRRCYRADHDKRVQGHSYPQSWYEDAIGELLEQVGGVDEGTISEAVRLYNDRPEEADRVTLARIRARPRGAWSSSHENPRRSGLADRDGSTRWRRTTGSGTNSQRAPGPARGRRLPALPTGAVGRLRPRWAPGPGSRLVRQNRSDRIRTDDLRTHARRNRIGPQRRTTARVRAEDIDW